VGLFDTHVRIRFVWKDLSPGARAILGRRARPEWGLRIRPPQKPEPQGRRINGRRAHPSFCV